MNFYFSIFFNYNILYFSYFSKLFIYLKSISIKEMFVFFYIYHKKKHSIIRYCNNFYLFLQKKTNKYSIYVNKLDFFSTVLMLLKKQLFLKKKMNSFFNFFLLKKRKYKLIMTSLIVFLNRNNVLFSYNDTSNLILKLELQFKFFFTKENKKVHKAYTIPNNKMLNLISVFLKRHMISYNDSVIKSYN